MALPPPADNWALFLDFDGTLVEIAETPEAIAVPEDLPAVLAMASASLGGALAVISGRRLADIDRFLRHTVTAVAGLHGLERRGADGSVHHVALPEAALNDARARLATFVAAHPGVLLEDKGGSVALHYRQAPAHGPACVSLTEELAAASGGRLAVQRGKMVSELRTAGRDKGDAVRDFMAEPPFAGRRLVFAGDDVTDEAAFAVANGEDGISIRVGVDGADTAACWTVPDVATLFTWLRDFPHAVEKARGAT